MRVAVGSVAERSEACVRAQSLSEAIGFLAEDVQVVVRLVRRLSEATAPKLGGQGEIWLRRVEDDGRQGIQIEIETDKFDEAAILGAVVPFAGHFYLTTAASGSMVMTRWRQ